MSTNNQKGLSDLNLCMSEMGIRNVNMNVGFKKCLHTNNCVNEYPRAREERALQ